MWKASAIAFGMSSALVTRKLCLVIGIVMPTMSASWKASVPIALDATWPVIATSGTESMCASAIGVTRLVAPGPRGRHADADLAGGLRVAGGRVARALLVPHEHVPHPGGVHQRVVRRKDRAAGNAEYRVGPDLLERADEGLRTRDVLDGADCCPPERGRGCGWWAPVACSVIGILFSMLRVFARFVRCAVAGRPVPVQQKTPRAVRQARGARRVRSLGSGSVRWSQLQPTRFPSTRIRVRMALTLPPARY